ncbi:uncharacterized protein L199_000316 [Kwoniella botswanensis]|uniref:uncharacterized protein n=1 Tax=Kwoniella botswanensis TaxID=1268659 RepID=UPI00315CD464
MNGLGTETEQDQDNPDAESFWPVNSSEAMNLNAREPTHIAEDTKIKTGLGDDYDWEDQVYYLPETMIVVRHGDSQIQIRVLSKADADNLRDNMGYSTWRRRDKTIV